jgi:uncharacterized protein (TIRG00374 family)
VSRRRRLPPALRRLVWVLSFFLVLHYLVVPELAGARDSASVLAHLNPLLVFVAVAAEAGSLVAYAQLTRSLLPADNRPGILAILRVQLATLGASHVIPGGTAAGTALGYRLLRRAGVSAPNTSFVLGAQSLGSAAVLCALLWIALAVSIPIRGANAAYLSIAIVGALVIGGFALLIFAVSRGSRAAERVVHAVAHRLPFVDGNALSGFVHDLVARFRELATDRLLLVRAAGWAGLQWLADAASLWVFLAAVGVHLEPDGLLIAFGLANLSAAIPLTPGGVGVYEAVLTSSLVGFGVPHAEAIIAVLVYRLVEFWLPIPVGAVAYLSAEAAEPRGHVSRVDALATVVTNETDFGRRRTEREPSE